VPLDHSMAVRVIRGGPPPTLFAPIRMLRSALGAFEFLRAYPEVSADVANRHNDA
jgi:hypothetical protein